LTTKILKKPELATDPRFQNNTARVTNREELVKIISDVLREHPRDHWLKEFTGLG
jgi:succinate--hydroxymethylglutarate CoA-transferase